MKESGVSSTGLIAAGVAAAYRNLVPAWRGAWASLLFCGLTWGLWRASMMQTPRAPSALAWFGLTAVAGLMAKGAVFRLALGRGPVGPGGLQLGRVELRLILVGLLTAAFLGILGLLYFVVLICTGYAVASSGPGFDLAQVATWSPAIVGNGRIAFGVVAASGAAAMVWAATRISLAAAVTVASGKLAVLSTWPLTRGRVVPIVIAALATAALPLAALALSSIVLRGLDAPGAYAARVALGVVLAGVWVPLSIGLAAYLYRRLA